MLNGYGICLHITDISFSICKISYIGREPKCLTVLVKWYYHCETAGKQTEVRVFDMHKETSQGWASIITEPNHVYPNHD